MLLLFLRDHIEQVYQVGKQIESAQQLLVEAGILLTLSLDYEVTLSNMAQLITWTIAE
jgi:hypothetical protein